MLLKNLFTGQQWRNITNRLMDMRRGEERVRCMERVRRKKKDQFKYSSSLSLLEKLLIVKTSGCVQYSLEVRQCFSNSFY